MAREVPGKITLSRMNIEGTTKLSMSMTDDWRLRIKGIVSGGAGPVEIELRLPRPIPAMEKGSFQAALKEWIEEAS